GVSMWNCCLRSSIHEMKNLYSLIDCWVRKQTEMFHSSKQAVFTRLVKVPKAWEETGGSEDILPTSLSIKSWQWQIWNFATNPDISMLWAESIGSCLLTTTLAGWRLPSKKWTGKDCIMQPVAVFAL